MGEVTTNTVVDDATKQLVQEASAELIKNKYDLIWNGDADSLKQLPIESLAPLLMLKHLSSVATFMDVQ